MQAQDEVAYSNVMKQRKSSPQVTASSTYLYMLILRN